MSALRRLAIINRGESAARFLRTVREHNLRSAERWESVVLYLPADHDADAVREADLAVPLTGAAPRARARGAGTPGRGTPGADPAGLDLTGPDLAAVERALATHHVDALWAGWGLTGVLPQLASLAERLGVQFLGPDPALLHTLEESLARAAEVAGSARSSVDGNAASPSGTELPRHLEVQVAVDRAGQVRALGVHERSLRRDGQVLVEESAPVPALGPDEAARVQAVAAQVVRVDGLAGLYAVEFVRSAPGTPWLPRAVHAGLRPGHPLTELVSGIDLVELQLHLTLGGRLDERAPAVLGHAVQVPITATGPAPAGVGSAARLLRLTPPSGAGVRVDAALPEGAPVPADSAQVLTVAAHGADRDQALARLRRAVEELTVVVEGAVSTRSFVLGLLSDEALLAGTPDTDLIDRVDVAQELAHRRHAGLALCAAAIDAYDEAAAVDRRRLLQTARGGRPLARADLRRHFDLRLDGVDHRVHVARTGADRFRVTLAGTQVDLRRERLDENTCRLYRGGTGYRVQAARAGAHHLVQVGETTHRITREEGGVVRAAAPAFVVAVPVTAGQQVSAGEPVAVLETMKMETVLVAPFAGRVREVFTAAGVQVEVGSPLVRVDSVAEDEVAEDEVAEDEVAEDAGPTAVAGPRTAGESSVSPASTASPESTVPELPVAPEPLGVGEAALANLTDLTSLLLGYDLGPEDARAALDAYRRSPALAAGAAVNGAGAGEETAAGAAEVRPDTAELFAAELAVLTAFTDVCELTRTRPAAEDGPVEHVHSPREFFHSYLRSLDADRERLPAPFREKLLRALAHYGVEGLDPARNPLLSEGVYRLFLAQQRERSHVSVVTALLARWLEQPRPPAPLDRAAGVLLDRLVVATQARYPAVGDLARSARFTWFEQPLVRGYRERAHAELRERLADLSGAHGEAPNPDRAALVDRIDRLPASPDHLVRLVAERSAGGVRADEPLLVVLLRRHYGEATPVGGRVEHGGTAEGGVPWASTVHVQDGRPVRVVTTVTTVERFDAVLTAVRAAVAAQGDIPEGTPLAVDLHLRWPDAPEEPEQLAEGLATRISAVDGLEQLERLSVAVGGAEGTPVRQLTLRRVDPSEDEDPATGGTPSAAGAAWREDVLVRGVHPRIAERCDLWRLRDFEVSRLAAPDGVLLYRCVAPANPSDQRLVAMALVGDLTVVRDGAGRVTSLPQVEHALSGALAAIRAARTEIGPRARLDANHVFLTVWPPVTAPVAELTALQRRIAPLTGGAGLTETLINGRVVAEDGTLTPVSVRFRRDPGAGVTARVGAPPNEPLAPLDDYTQKTLRARARGNVYPYELIPRLIGEHGTFVEHDLDPDGRLVPVNRPGGRNKAGVVVGLASRPTPLYPEGMTRVVVMGDPVRALGAVAEPECARIMAALDLAEQLHVPMEWFALSSGARISMESGTENMDWVSRALRRIVTYTQAGGEINVVVTGINVGAQPYWNAEATMLMHTRGILVMTPDSAMVLTGKQALDYSGGVSAEDNHGIGGYDRVMGPNGQAQYWAPDLGAAIQVLFAHYDFSYVAPGESAPRIAPTDDDRNRDVTPWPHRLEGSDFTTVGDIFSPLTNPERKKAFDIRAVLAAVADTDHPTLERWAGMADAETSVVLDARLGGHAVCLIGIESRPIRRLGFPPTDGPSAWTSGTLFPRSSKKTARAINATSGNRPLVVVANLSGFDGSPESMRRLQLEYGAEIGRAVVNFDGPVVFAVVSRYHGGAFVVFSKALHDNLRVLAVEGSYASVIGGAPAAAAVFAGEVDSRTNADPRIAELNQQLRAARGPAQARLRTELAELRPLVRSEKLSEVAAEFDAVHSIQRAVKVGSVDEVIRAQELRPRLIEAVERGLAVHAERRR